jgi:hypothetical protein
MAWHDEPAWQNEILAKIPSGVDPVQVERCLRLSPTERLEEMRKLLLSLEGARARGDRLSEADRDSR